MIHLNEPAAILLTAQVVFGLSLEIQPFKLDLFTHEFSISSKKAG